MGSVAGWSGNGLELWLEFYIGQTLQNQSSVMSDTRGYGGIH